jgi:hypothetical protein
VTALLRPNPVATGLRAGGTACGTMAFEFFTPGLIAILAEAGADFVLLDPEHLRPSQKDYGTHPSFDCLTVDENDKGT